MRMSLPFLRLDDLMVFTSNYSPFIVCEEDGRTFTVQPDERDKLPDYAVQGIRATSDGMLMFIVKPC